MKRYSFVGLKTFLNTKFWVFNELNSLSSFEFLKNNGTILGEESLEGGLFKNSNVKLKNLAFSRFIKTLSNKKDVTNSNLLLRVTNLTRFFRSNAFLRRYWWRMARRFKCFSSFQQSVKVFRLNSFWRYPFKQNKILELSRRNLKLKLVGVNRQRIRQFYLPKQLSKRIKSFYFLNKGFWRSLDTLITVRIRFTLNNLFVTLTNKVGKNLVSFSSGSVGFKGTTKLTTYAIEKVALQVAKFLKKRRLKGLYLIFNSGAVGYKSKIFIETLVYNSLIIKYLTVSDSIPHNGVRLRKTKRR